MVLEFDENIKSLIPEVKVAKLKPPLHHSVFSSKVHDEKLSHKKCHQTMGYAQIKLNPPSCYLKKKTRIVRRPHVEDKKPINLEPKPPVPSFKIKPKKNDKASEKNFRKQNIIHMIKSTPKKPTPALVDTPYGNKQKLKPSGLLPNFIFKEGFGKVPNYLLIRKKEAEDIEDRIKEKESKIRPPLRYITEDERQELLEGLHKNWRDLQKEFQLLPMVTDTIPKIKRKTQLEKELKELEKDIEIVERNPLIYVNENRKLNQYCNDYNWDGDVQKEMNKKFVQCSCRKQSV
ncbi:enkurin-like [Lycorma delicatula]|uniref:enkurin-like n=1 Tax=Lycorma delicatula TaxID=130591 RepID=UPI003F515107